MSSIGCARAKLMNTTLWILLVLLGLVGNVMPDIACNGIFNFHCVNCSTLLSCVDGIAYPETLTTCPPDTQCNIYSPYGCDALHGCRLPEFDCPSAGVHPDLEDCSSYHMCKENGETSFFHFVYSCPKGTLFDAPSSKCVVEDQAECVQFALF